MPAIELSPLADGSFYLRNIYSGNRAALLNDDDEEPVVAWTDFHPEDDALAQWKIKRLDNGRCLIQHRPTNRYMSLHVGAGGDACVYGRTRTPTQVWEIKECAIRGQYSISSKHLCLGMTDREIGTQVTLFHHEENRHDGNSFPSS